MRRLGYILFVIFLFSTIRLTAQDTPYISGTSLLKIFSSDGGVGMAIEPTVAPENDVLTLKSGDNFTVTITTLDSYYVVSGKMVLAITRGNEIVEILAKRTIPTNISSISFVYFNCLIGKNTEILPGDELRLLTTYDEIMYSTVDAAYGHDVVDRIPAVGYKLPLHNIHYDSNIDGVTIESSPDQAWTDKVVHGRNFYLYINKENEEDVLVVRANGNAWLPESGVYMLKGVVQDVDVEIKLYKGDDYHFYRVITVTEGVRVADLLTDEQLDYTKGLKVKGYVKAEDFVIFRSKMPSLEVLDLSEAEIENDYLPENAFNMNATLIEVRLPEGLVGFANNVFRYATKLQEIVLPSTLNVFGYNTFFGCGDLKKVWVKWNPIAAGVEPLLGFPIPPCAFRATSIASEGLLVVPKGCVDAYANTENWSKFKTIREVAPVDKALMERSFDRFNPVETGLLEPEMEEVKVKATEGGCEVILSRPSPVMIIDMCGQCVVEKNFGIGKSTIALKQGVFIVKVKGQTFKILVR